MKFRRSIDRRQAKPFAIPRAVHSGAAREVEDLVREQGEFRDGEGERAGGRKEGEGLWSLLVCYVGFGHTNG
jgi:hypothetical protein